LEGGIAMPDEPGSSLGRAVAGGLSGLSGLSRAGRGSDATKNIFWIAASLTFDLQTGATNQILTFAYREQDASIFKEPDAEVYKEFVRVRAERYSAGISWFVEASSIRPNRYVIRGEQDAV
jgi:hypothetical protein